MGLLDGIQDFIDDVTGKSGTRKAAEAQVRSSQAGIDELRRQFDITQGLFSPYIGAGRQGLQGYLDLLGLGEGGSQNEAIAALQDNPLFKSLLQQAETSVLQNAAATGGLRGGNVQSALGQISPNLLGQFLQDQFNRYSNLMQFGQSSAAGQAAQGQQTSQNIASLFGEQGAAQAGRFLSDASFNRGLLNTGVYATTKALGGGQ